MTITDYLTPTTLAQMCADIAEQAHMIGMDEQAKTQAIQILEAGRGLVGNDEFDKMIEDILNDG